MKPSERGILNVTVAGGKLRALGSACPYYERSYLDTECDMYYGEALAIVEIEADTTVRVKSRQGNCEAFIRCLE